MTNIDKDQAAIELSHQIKNYLDINSLSRNLPEITYEVLALQIMQSIEQEQSLQALFVNDNKNNNINKSHINHKVCDPYSELFDPIKAVVYLTDRDYDEACWLSYLLIYTDDSADKDWSFMRPLYQGVGLDFTPFTWETVSRHSDLLAVFNSLAQALALQQPKPKFGHHRAYESLGQLPTVFNSYIGFIEQQGGHKSLFKFNKTAFNQAKTNQSGTNQDKPNLTNKDKQENFKALYSLIRKNIYRFGRLSTFEYLCWLGKMGLADVEPDNCYLAEASGPKRGAKLLFGMLSDEQLDIQGIGLADYLQVGYQIIEAALCHWQKSPQRFVKYD